MTYYAEPEQARSIRLALSLFWRTIRSGWFFRLWARLTHQPDHLIDLDETLCCNPVKCSHYAGTMPVEIKRIRGTESKAEEFDADFHPLKESSLSRWLGVALERLRGHDLPPVDLIDIDGIYYVRDGHHRISVARSLGQAYIDAEVVRMSLDRHQIGSLQPGGKIFMNL